MKKSNEKRIGEKIRLLSLFSNKEKDEPFMDKYLKYDEMIDFHHKIFKDDI